jgi:hypothetical protein
MGRGVKIPWGFNLPYRRGQFSIRGFNIPWMKIDPGVKIPYDTGVKIPYGKLNNLHT